VDWQTAYQARWCAAAPAGFMEAWQGWQAAAPDAEGSEPLAMQDPDEADEDTALSRGPHWLIGSASVLRTVAGWLATLPPRLAHFAVHRPVWLPHPRGQLHLPPHGNATPQGLGEQQSVGPPARGRDHQAGVGRQIRGGSRPEPHLGAKGLEDGCLLGMRRRLVKDRDVSAERQQPVGSRISRDPKARDHGVHLAPVAQPVRRQEELIH